MRIRKGEERMVELSEEQVIKRIGRENWKSFDKFITGQTVHLENGKTYFYDYDVAKFESQLRQSTGNRGRGIFQRGDKE